MALATLLIPDASNQVHLIDHFDSSCSHWCAKYVAGVAWQRKVLVTKRTRSSRRLGLWWIFSLEEMVQSAVAPFVRAWLALWLAEQLAQRECLWLRT